MKNKTKQNYQNIIEIKEMNEIFEKLQKTDDKLNKTGKKKIRNNLVVTGIHVKDKIKADMGR